MDVELLEELQTLQRELVVHEKATKYLQLTEEIESMMKTNKFKVPGLARERDALKFKPTNIKEVKARGAGLVDKLSRRVDTLLLEHQAEEAARGCAQLQDFVKNMFERANLSLTVVCDPTLDVPSLPAPPLPPFNSRYTFKCDSHPITLSEERCVSREAEVYGVFFGEFSAYGTKKEMVAVKVWREGRDLEHEYKMLRALSSPTPSGSDKEEFGESSFLQAFSLEMGQQLLKSKGSYLVLEDFGSDLRTVMRSDNQVARKTIIVPLLVRVVSDLHRKGVMHGDLKPQNVLVKHVGGGSYQMKLCDFDSSRLVGESLSRDAQGRLKFSSSWVSPEVFHAANAKVNINVNVNGDQKESELLSSLSIDLFSLGLLIEVLCRKHCDPSSTALPTVSEDPDHIQLCELLSNQSFLDERMESLRGEHSQTEVVRQLLRLFPPSDRGDILQIQAKYQNDIGATNGLRQIKKQETRIAKLNEMIVHLTETQGTESKSVSVSDLEGSLSDIVLMLSNEWKMHKQEVMAKLCGGEEDRRDMLEKISMLRDQLSSLAVSPLSPSSFASPIDSSNPTKR